MYNRWIYISPISISPKLSIANNFLNRLSFFFYNFGNLMNMGSDANPVVIQLNYAN